MKIFIEQDYEAASKKAAEIFLERIQQNPDGCFGFATGGTPVGMYKLLAVESDLLARITAFNLDEYYPIEPQSEQSYARFMAENLFDLVGLDAERRHIPNGMAQDATAECARYERLISELGGVRMQMLGIGHNGHIGFNEPADDFSSCTCCVELAKETIEANARFFGSLDQVPRRAITMGVRTIMMSKEILLLATGTQKAEILRSALCGPITPRVPASVLQLHRKVTVVACQEAGKLL